ncbi:hypothetical protein NQ317_000605 [Molorchus minor]|uniref:Reverse transcriptase n=1 Tax=Molorchus minor TaxID=1323400 RepID=A0ABQ9JQZ9_9CUCU|nr:hypothetical protein NQ317_000605 [Molorchus minor]
MKGPRRRQGIRFHLNDTVIEPRRAVKYLGVWLDDKGNFGEHGLTGHGSFIAYTKRIGKTDNDLCRYCEQVDTAEHTIFHCERWSRLRQEAAQRMNTDIGPENIVGEMISDREKWNAGHDMIRKIMEEKEREERPDQERLERERAEENLIG